MKIALSETRKRGFLAMGPIYYRLQCSPFPVSIPSQSTIGLPAKRHPNVISLVRDCMLAGFIILCLGSIGIDHVISELCYKDTILQKNYSLIEPWAHR